MTERLAIVDEVAAINPWPADTQYRRIIHVGGRGYGKAAAAQAWLQSQMPVAESPYADWLNEEWDRIVGYARYRSNVLGHFDYTPRDELRDRLNAGLIGKTQAPVINTRYWRNQ